MFIWDAVLEMEFLEWRAWTFKVLIDTINLPAEKLFQLILLLWIVHMRVYICFSTPLSILKLQTFSLASLLFLFLTLSLSCISDRKKMKGWHCFNSHFSKLSWHEVSFHMFIDNLYVFLCTISVDIFYQYFLFGSLIFLLLTLYL